MNPSEPILNEEPTIQPEPPIHVPTQSNSQVKSLKLIIGLLSVLLVLILGGMRYLYSQLQSVKKTTNPQITQTPLITPLAKAQTETDSEVSSDWKTYENMDYNFEIKYPLGWFIEEGKSENLTDDAVVIKNFNQQVLGISDIANLETFEGIGYVEIFISKDKNPSQSIKTKLEEERQECIDGGGCAPGPDKFIKELNIGSGNIPATMAEGGTPNIISEFESYTGYFVKNSGYIYRIRLRTQDIETSNTFDQILSTFRFTGENLAISNDWKSYENLTFNYSLKYPRDWEIFKQTDTDEVMSLRPIGMQEIPIIISVHKQNKNLNTLEWLSSMYSNLSQYTSEKVIIDNKEMIKFYNTNQDNPYPSINYFLVEDDNYYEISCTTLEQQKYIKVFDEILSTFRFTE